MQTQEMMNNTLAALHKLNADRNAGVEGILQDKKLSDEEVGQLIPFLASPTHACFLLN